MESIVRDGSTVNVGRVERIVSLIAGGAAVLAGVRRLSLASIPLALGGGYFLYRGATGHCPTYAALGINRVAGEDGSRGIIVERSVTVKRPVQEVYAFWHNFENLSRFMSHVAYVEVTGDRRSHWVAEGPIGTRLEWDAEIMEERKNELILWRSLPGSQIDNAGYVSFKPAPADRGTEVHVSLAYDPPAGSLGAAFAKLFGKDADAEVREDLRRFKEMMETGEIATNDGQTSGRERDRNEVARKSRLAGWRRRKDVVQEASEESFPASDAPAWGSGQRRAA